MSGMCNTVFLLLELTEKSTGDTCGHHDKSRRLEAPHFLL